ncbi:MAG: hypothetical protein KI791_07935, partial [Cyclobacteriaceae bacterium]|nr:hypothetical protein [Cyclobacteriaceae bacterium SS2]
MKLAITTYNYFGIFDTESHDLQILDEGKGKYFGITWDENFLYATVGVRLNLGEQYGQKKERILVFDKALKRQSDFFESDIGLNNVHQLFDTGETMWVANSGKNRIEIIDKELKTIKHWYPFFFKRNKDINHLNSIFIKDNKLYLLAHNNQKPSIAYEYSYP